MTEPEMTYQILQGDCMEVLKALESESVQTCVTSPPYFGLRDYGTADWTGGDAECDHTAARRNATKVGGFQGERIRNNDYGEGDKYQSYDRTCASCGAIRVDSQIGLEETPALYVAKMVEVFGEVRRVLKKDGTLWLNLGDSYASNWPCNRRNIVGSGSLENGKRENRPPRGVGMGIKDKDLIGIPWRVAFALQEAGWWLRQDIIWAKPNPMPESVTDRCTKAHEYIFLLTKSAKYFYDNEAVREPMAMSSISRLSQDVENQVGSDRVPGKTNGTMKAVARGGVNAFRGQGHFRNGDDGPANRNGRDMKAVGVGEDRNKRSVWTVTTRPFKDAHFATFPPKLIEPCILAGSREGDLVLDPFSGAGTTLMVALQHHRRGLGIELNPEYIAITEKRLRDVQVNLF